MLKIDRQELIKQILKKDGSILISDISQQLDCSSETIRRDLLELEKQGFAKKIYGGAYIPNEYDKSVPVSLRNTFFNEEKLKWLIVYWILSKMVIPFSSMQVPRVVGLQRFLSRLDDI